MRATIRLFVGGLATLIAVPASASSNTATIVIEAPAPNSTMAQPFTISGFAIDTTGTTGTGVDQVHIWAIPASGPNVFLGIATYGIQRQDVGATYGSRFTNSGYSLVVAGIAPGAYQVVVFAHSTVTGAWDSVDRNVTFTANPVMWVDSPTHNASVAQPFSIVGWAIDLAAASGAGVDQVHVYAFKNPGSGTPAEFWGAATYGLTRDDVGGFYGAQFLHSGFSLPISGKPAAVYYVIVYAHSTVGNTWQAQGFVIYVDMPVVELTIDRQGTGTGGISAAGLTCAGGSTTQAVPCAASYALNTQVQLTAVPDQGNAFGGWQGACTGTSPTCMVTLSSPANVSARFVKNVGTMTATYYHTDAIGSVRAVTNEAGAIVKRHDYGPFGTDNQPMTGDAIRFAGKELDPETGQHYSIARYYRNKWGRFLTVDPLVGNPGHPQTLNPYTYALNNPLRFVDPLGLCVFVRNVGVICDLTVTPAPGGGGPGEPADEGIREGGGDPEGPPGGLVTPPVTPPVAPPVVPPTVLPPPPTVPGTETTTTTTTEQSKQNTCQTMSGTLATISAGTPTNLLPAVGQALVWTAFGLPRQASSLPSDGYRTEFTDGGQLGGVNRHILAGAGATVSLPPLLYLQVMRDVAEFSISSGQRHEENRSEIRSDMASFKVGVYMWWASITGDAAGAKTSITRIICDK